MRVFRYTGLLVALVRGGIARGSGSLSLSRSLWLPLYIALCTWVFHRSASFLPSLHNLLGLRCACACGATGTTAQGEKRQGPAKHANPAGIRFLPGCISSGPVRSPLCDGRVARARQHRTGGCPPSALPVEILWVRLGICVSVRAARSLATAEMGTAHGWVQTAIHLLLNVAAAAAATTWVRACDA